MKKRIGIILGILIMVFLLRDYINIETLVSTIEKLQENPLAPLVFIVIYAVAVTFGVPATAFTLIAPPIFGFWFGVFLIIIASNLGCHLSYWLAKILGKDVILKCIKEGTFLDTATTKAQKNGFIFIMYARLIPIFPFAAVNYLSGIINIKYRDYALATFLGMIPGTVVYAYLGYTASNIKENPLGVIVSITVLVLFTVAVTIISKRKDRLENEEKSV